VATTSILGGVKPDGTTITVDASGKISAISDVNSADIIVYSKLVGNYTEIWKVRTDGSNNQKINIVLPANTELNVNDGGAFKLNRSATKLIFQAKTTCAITGSLYSCNLDGTSVTKVVDGIYEL
jgi:hypothetical protein